MSNERQCRLCKHMIVKNKLFGGEKYICSIQNRRVNVVDLCSQFMRDGSKVLQCAGFRSHEFASPDSCQTCTYRRSIHEEKETIYTCQKNNVRLWSGFSPMDYVCDNFENGGLDALVGYMSDLLIEEDRIKKGTK